MFVLLILPRGLVDRFHGRSAAFSTDAEARKRIEDAAMKAVFDAEHALDYKTKDVHKDNCGWDITSTMPNGQTRHIEVKGRHPDAETITVTHNEVLTALNQGDKFILAIVRVREDSIDGPHYIRAPFSQEPEPGMVSIQINIKTLLERAGPPDRV